MLQLTPQMRIFVACQPVDFRKGMDSLAGYCRSRLDRDPLSGALFLFHNRSRTSIRILVYDGQGIWLCTKRLSRGKLSWWPDSSGQPISELAAWELNILLWNGNPQQAGFSEEWRPVSKVGEAGSSNAESRAPKFQGSHSSGRRATSDSCV